MSSQVKTENQKPHEAVQQTPPKRRPGRPRKTDKPVVTGPRGVKSEAAKLSRLAAKRAGTSTRELIIASANQIINRTGVVDFRIETLAQTLSLSPGNITYHFPKKEDIITAIWEEYISVMRDTTEEMLTPLLDIKQLFLYFRTAAAKAVSYVGVICYYYGDMGALRRENAAFRKEIELSREKIFASYDTLARNGYMKPIEDPELRELTFNSQVTMLRWWLNHALAKVGEQNLTSQIDRYVGLSLLQLLPYLTEEGKRQFASIINLIK